MATLFRTDVMQFPSLRIRCNYDLARRAFVIQTLVYHSLVLHRARSGLT
jgi:hypothetical protein